MSGPRRALAIAAIDAAILALVFLAAETAVRWHREGGLAAALASYRGGAPGRAGASGHGLFLADPELGYRLNPAEEGIDELGLRHPEIGAKPAGARRVLVVGDSVAWDRGGFVDLLRAELERAGGVEVINASVPGYTTYQERVLFGRLAGPVAPDVVVLEYCTNDNHRFLHQLSPDGEFLITQEARAALLPAGGGLLARAARWSYLAFELRRRIYSRRYAESGGFAWERQPDFCAAWQDATWADEREHVLAIQGIARGAGAELLVIAVPYEPQLDPALLEQDREYVQKPQRCLAAICAELGIPLADPFDEFLARRSEGLYTDRVHLTPAGHAIVARRLATELEARGWSR